MLKWQRTRRQVQLLNKPGSMFEATHLVSSGKLQKQTNSLQTTIDDIGFNRKYDETLANQSLLGGISHTQRSSIGEDFDHSVILDNKVKHFDNKHLTKTERSLEDDTLCMPSTNLPQNQSTVHRASREQSISIVENPNSITIEDQKREK